MSKKPIPFPTQAALEKHREMARRHCRVICHICGKRYALDFWSSICELNPADAVVRPFPSGKVPITPKVTSELPCVSSPSGVIHVMTAKRAALRTTTMTTFTIDPDNNIMAHHTPEEAAATTANPFDSFTSPQELAELAKSWPATRLVAIWNSLPGVPPIQKFKDHHVAATRIWKRLGGLAASAPSQPAQPAKPRQGNKTAQVVAMLRRKNGATLAEIMKSMGWQKHTVRGFMAGAMKKAGHTVESFKPDGGVRTYRIK